MQRFILVRVFQAFISLIAVTIIIFSLGRITGNPLDVLLPLEAEESDRIRVEKIWGLDKPITTQYFIFVKKAATGDFGESIKWRGNSAMGLVLDRLPATAILACSLNPGLNSSSHSCPATACDWRSPRI